MQDSNVSSRSSSGAQVIIVGLAGLVAMLLAITAVTLSPRDAAANPAAAQKTGQPCGKCHTAAPPALNSYGKSYKAKGK